MLRVPLIGLLILLGLGPADKTGAQTFLVLHSFTGLSGPLTSNAEGARPVSSLAEANNWFYGTASQGGVGGAGAIFSMDANGGSFSNLHAFPPVSGAMSTNGEGANPVTGLVSFGGVLYGVASRGGVFGAGTVFKINTDATGFTNLHHFTAMSGPLFANSDGAHPIGLLLSGDTLYGTARDGGLSGNGTVFALNTNGNGFTTLHSFSPAYFHSSGYYTNQDGANPLAGLVLSSNTLYGTAVYGGQEGQGDVFAIQVDGSGFTNLHSFTAGAMNSLGLLTNHDGANPSSTLLIVGQTLYGTAQNGGDQGQGTAFALGIEGGFLARLHSFNAQTDGANPVAGFVLANNVLYGTASSGGTAGQGSIYAIDLAGGTFTNQHSFTAQTSLTNHDGAVPLAGLLWVGGGLYGSTYQAGLNGAGTVFTISPGAASLPLLSIRRSGETLVLWWPVNANGFTLQSAPRLNPPVLWTNDIVQPIVVDGNLAVTNGISNGQTIYRLIR